MGFLGGANFTLANYDFPKEITIDNAYVSSWQSDPGPGFSLGFDIEYDLSDKLFASTGIVLNKSSFKAIKTDDFINSENVYKYYNQFSLLELQLPLLLHFRVGKFSFGLGPYAAMALGGNFKFKALENGDQEAASQQDLFFSNNGDDFADFRPINAGLFSEVGYGVKRWRVAAHFDLGLLNLASKMPANGFEVQKYPLKRSSLGLTFLYQPWPR